MLITDHNVRETLKITDRALHRARRRHLQERHAGGLAADEEVKRIYLGADFRLD